MNRTANVCVLVALVALGLAACGGSSSSTIVDSRDPAAASSAPSEASSPATQPTSTAPSPSSSSSASPPAISAAERRLKCLAKYFVGTPTKAPDGNWSLKLPDGTELPWDDGKTKSFDEALAAPDLEDTLAMPYPTGPIVPVNKANDDPGRIRNDVLFKATFGQTAAAVEAKLVNVDFVGQSVTFHPLASAALARVSTKLTQLIGQTSSLASFVTGPLGGTYVWRPILNTNRMSAHSYGIAIDIATASSNYWEWEKKADGSFTWKNSIPQAIVDAFESERFAWGGRWAHFDTMHFEYRPELFDPDCAP